MIISQLLSVPCTGTSYHTTDPARGPHWGSLTNQKAAPYRHQITELTTLQLPGQLTFWLFKICTRKILFLYSMYKGESPIPTVKEQENSQLLTSSVQIPLLSSPISAPQSCCLFSLYFAHPSDVRSIFLLSIKSGKKGPEARLTGSITASAPNACPALAAILKYVDCR